MVDVWNFGPVPIIRENPLTGALEYVKDAVGGEVYSDRGRTDRITTGLAQGGVATTTVDGDADGLLTFQLDRRGPVFVDFGDGPMAVESPEAEADSNLYAETDGSAGGGGGGTPVGPGTIGTLELANDAVTLAKLAPAVRDAIANATDPESVRDTIAAALRAGTNVTITTDDAANTITLSAATDPEVVRDIIGAALVAGPNVSIAVSDSGDTITISASPIPGPPGPRGVAADRGPRMGIVHVGAESPSVLDMSRADVQAIVRDTFNYQNNYVIGVNTTTADDLTHNSSTPFASYKDLAQLDAKVADMEKARRTGGEVMLTFYSAPFWMLTNFNNPPSTPTNATAMYAALASLRVATAREDDFAAWCAFLASRYEGVRYFNVWNELKGYFRSDLNRWDYESYTRMWKKVYNAVKAVRPDALLGGPYLPMVSYGTNTGATPSASGRPAAASLGYGGTSTTGGTTIGGTGWRIDGRTLDVGYYFEANTRDTPPDFITVDGGIFDVKDATNGTITPASVTDVDTTKRIDDRSKLTQIGAWLNSLWPNTRRWWVESYYVDGTVGNFRLFRDGVTSGGFDAFFVWNQRPRDGLAWNNAVDPRVRTAIGDEYADQAYRVDGLNNVSTLDREVIRDTIGATLVGGTNVTVTPDDDADQIVLSVALASEPGVYLTEDRYPGCTSDVFATAGAARDQAIADCFRDSSGSITTRPRPLMVPPCTRNTAVASGSKAGHYSWPALDFDWITRTAMGVSSPSGTVNLGWSMQGVHGTDMYGNVAVKTPSSTNAFLYGSTYNHGDFLLKGMTWVGPENIATTMDGFRVPGGRAFYDLTLENVSFQWYRYQLRGAFGRLNMFGRFNFNNAAGQPIQLSGSDGGIYGTVFVDSRALPAGVHLVEFAGMTSFKSFANMYLTPNSAAGLKASNGCEGLVIAGLEVNGLGVQAPEACYDATKHIGSGLLTSSPSVDPTTVPGLIYVDTTSKLYVKSNGKAQNTATGDGWSVFYDGSAPVPFNGMANRPDIASATPGKVYQNTGAEANATGGTNPTICHWVPWGGIWHGPSFWNQRPVPTSLVSGASPTHVQTPVYVDCDGPGLSLIGIKGDVKILSASLKMVNGVPGIVTNADGAVQISDCEDMVDINVGVSQIGSGRRALAVANSGAVSVVDVRAAITMGKVPRGETPAATKVTGACRVFRDGVWRREKTSTETRNNTTAPSDTSGLDVVVKAGEIVEVDGELAFSASTGAGGCRLQWSTGGTDLTGRVTFDVLATGASGGSSSRNAAACITNGSGAVTGGVPTGNVITVPFRGRLVGGTTDSTWRIQLAQWTASAADTLTLLSGSHVRARRVEA